MNEDIMFECPRCSSTLFLDPVDSSDGTIEVYCDDCDATIRVTYSVSVEIEETEVVDANPVESACPVCDLEVEIDPVEEESGSEEFVCENEDCEAQFLVEWSNWGGEVDTTLLVEPERKSSSGSGNDRDEEESEYNHDQYYDEEENEEEDDEKDDEDDDEDDYIDF